MKRILNNIPIFAIIELFALLVCLYGIYKSCWMNSVGVSLWLDEAYQACSLTKRSLWNLTSGILEYNQTAPIGWLYVNKLMTLALGNSEFVLRIFSVFSYASILFLVWYISKKYFRLRLPLLASAYIASMSFALQYSIMFKSYISDGMFVLIALWAYLSLKNRNKPFLLGGIWAVLLWFSNPVCFIVGGIILSEVVYTTVLFLSQGHGDTQVRLRPLVQEIKPWIIAGTIVLCSFVIYWLYWLHPVAIGAPMQDYWRGQNFPLIPTSLADLQKMKSMTNEIFRHFSDFASTMFIGLLATLILGIYKKDRIIIGIYLGIFLALLASFINMFPVEDRMWFFIYPLASLLFFVGLDGICHFNKGKRGEMASTLVMGALGIFAIMLNKGFIDYSTADKVYRAGEETNYEVEYVRENIQADESVYVYKQSIPGFTYKNGYNTVSIGDYCNNIIYASGFLIEGEDYSKDIVNIQNAHNCYIVLSHIVKERIYGIKHDLPRIGYLELVRDDYSTPLLYWTDDISKAKSRVELSVIKKEERDSRIFETVRISNVGETVLNSPFNRAFLVSLDCDILCVIPEEIRQNQHIDISFDYPIEYNPVLRLVDSNGKEICINAETNA